jgi:hypothetical protein
MDRSAIAFLLAISVGMWGAVAYAADGLRIVLDSLGRHDIPAARFACGLILVAAAYVALRGLVAFVLSVRWVISHWGLSRREDLRRRGLLVGWSSAFEFSVMRRSKAQIFEYAELNAIVVFCFGALWYLRSTGVCSKDGMFGNRCLSDVGLLFGVPFASLVASYILRRGPQPRPS